MFRQIYLGYFLHAVQKLMEKMTLLQSVVEMLHGHMVLEGANRDCSRIGDFVFLFLKGLVLFLLNVLFQKLVWHVN